MKFSFSLSAKTANRIFIAALAVVAAAISFFGIFDSYELQTYDWRCKIRGPRPVSDKIVFIDIWNDSLETFGAWPFDRAYHAELINILKEVGAKAVLFDILFIEPKDGDKEVTEAAKQASNIYFAYAFQDPTSHEGRIVSPKIQESLLESYQASAKATGFVNAKVDIDGKIRRMIPAVWFNGQWYFHLSLRVLMDLYGIPPSEVRVIPGKYLELGKNIRIPLDLKGYLLINYAGVWEKTFEHRSYADVIASYYGMLEGKAPRTDLNFFKDKICVVGLTALGSHDTKPTPLQPICPAVATYANVMNSVLNQDFIRRANPWINVLLLLIIGSAVIWISEKMKPLKGFIATMLLLIAFITLTIGVFWLWGYWIDLFYPMCCFVLLYAGSKLYRIAAEIRKRELMENELRVASQIQKSFLPETLPSISGLELAVYMKPAKAVGGDLYNFIQLEDKKLGLMVGDVSGKGTPAALFMAKTASEFKFYSKGKQDVAEVLTSVNNSIASESTGGLFVTMSYAIFDVESKLLFISNGGHLPIVRVRKNGQKELLTAEEGMPIGVMPDIPFSAFQTDIQSGDILAFYSDGISEARNTRKEEYGVENLQKTIHANHDFEVQKITDAVIADIARFSGKAEQHDDMTLILVKVLEAGSNEK